MSDGGSFAVSQKMNRNSYESENSLSPPSSPLVPTDNQVLSIVDDLSTRFDFNSLEDLHSTLLSAAQAEHARVRERAQRLLELEQIRYERDRLKNVADVAEERFRIETAKEAEARRIRHTENKVQKLSKSSSSVIIQPKSSKVKLVESIKSKSVGTIKHKSEEIVKHKAAETVKPKPVEGNKIKPVEPSKPNLVETDKPNPPETSKLRSRETLQLKPSSSTQLKPNSIKSSSVLAPLESDPYVLPAKPISHIPTESSVTHRPTINQSNQALHTVVEQPALNKNASKIARSTDSKTTVPLNQFSIQKSNPEIQHHDTAKFSRYREIHTQMKLVRRQVESQIELDGKPTKLRSMCSGGRREITKALGQLVVGGKNTAIAEKVVHQLVEALQDKTQLVQLSLFTVTNYRMPSETPLSAHNVGITEDQVSLAFIYLLGSLCKAICAQLVSEAALKPRAASPIGMLAAKVFSNPHLLWRGNTLIDILISKFFVVCPVLFGIRGDESTQEGRAQIGWRRMNGRFISEQAHFDRMTGIAAGYAAISLRDFSRTRWKNPFPPTNYWLALSAIVSTPSDQTSPTQFVVLKGLIEHHFPRFILFYGDMAVAALQAALVEFPKRGAAANAAVGTLKTLGITLQKDHGLTLF